MNIKYVLTIGIAVLAAGVSHAADAVKIGSKNFTEQFIVSEIYAQALEKAGVRVERRFNLGTTAIAHTALLSGDIDLYPEYTGTALADVVKGDLSGSAEDIYATVKKYYEDHFKVTLLKSSNIDNGYAIMMLPATAQKYHLKTLSDLGPVSDKLVFGAEAGYEDRKDGLIGLRDIYGIKFKDYKVLAKLGLRYSALQSGDLDVSFGFGTDWQIKDQGLVVMEDNKHLFPPYYLVPFVRQDAVAKDPMIAKVLDKVDPLLTSERMRELNAEVDRDEEEPADVAAKFLSENGF
ncbi:glycine betaine ABC transporter substrate-binding protein [Rhizobium calliandrae]|uniref:Glycine betaine ABC transporter substrate-binding protein n=1 Tax=Rhizobium calliandrae TaxID=1312182 RepID=A0ABT7KFG4_9HYPH|nr:glycine betaine ABC transporter substrate-binding protein [Rhizobium calliandrae]MDL2406937.1 glycine betaine ABC transporter substrate-binding protein [Rhizobium calliandrae]